MIVGPRCPICGRRGCWRRIAPYTRGVIELFPYAEGVVQVLRGQCGCTGRTFSLLPVELILYYRYTASSVVGALLLAWVAVREQGGGFGRVLEQDPRFVPESRLTAWLLETWLDALLTGLRRGTRCGRRVWSCRPSAARGVAGGWSVSPRWVRT